MKWFVLGYIMAHLVAGLVVLGLWLRTERPRPRLRIVRRDAA